MLKYTMSAVKDTLDFIKRLIHIFLIVIQLVYILYIVYRLVDKSGNTVINIILLVISTGYLLYQFITTREFYTDRQRAQKKVIKWSVKASKYIANIYIISLGVVQLISGNAENENATMLITVFMIVGVLFSVLFDIILILIDKQIALIKTAIMYDIERFKAHHDLATKAIKRVGVDLEKEYPNVDDKRAIHRVKMANYKQERKKVRKSDFLKRQKMKRFRAERKEEEKSDE